MKRCSLMFNCLSKYDRNTFPSLKCVVFVDMDQAAGRVDDLFELERELSALDSLNSSEVLVILTVCSTISNKIAEKLTTRHTYWIWELVASRGWSKDAVDITITCGASFLRQKLPGVKFLFVTSDHFAASLADELEFDFEEAKKNNQRMNFVCPQTTHLKATLSMILFGLQNPIFSLFPEMYKFSHTVHSTDFDYRKNEFFDLANDLGLLKCQICQKWSIFSKFKEMLAVPDSPDVENSFQIFQDFIFSHIKNHEKLHLDTLRINLRGTLREDPLWKIFLGNPSVQSFFGFALTRNFVGHLILISLNRKNCKPIDFISRISNETSERDDKVRELYHMYWKRPHNEFLKQPDLIFNFGIDDGFGNKIPQKSSSFSKWRLGKRNGGKNLKMVEWWLENKIKNAPFASENTEISSNNSTAI